MDVFRPRLTHLAFQGIHQGCRFSGDEGTRALVHGHIEIKASTQYVLAEQAFLEPVAGQILRFPLPGVFHAHVDEPLCDQQHTLR